QMTGEGFLKLDWTKTPQSSVSVILVPQPESRLNVTISSAKEIIKRSGPEVLEILIPSTEEASTGDERIRLVPIEPSSSLANRLNQVCSASRGAVLVFVDAALTVTDSWTRELA